VTVELAEAHRAELEAVAREQGPDGEPRRLLSITDLSQLPPPSWTLEGLLPAGGFTVLYGPSGAGKSFLGLDWGLCIAAGIPWYGREAKAGWVLYIAAEGVSGLHRRAQAWQTARSTDHVERIRFLPEAVNLLDRQELDGARRTLHELPEPPALIVIDTMARTMVGGDENAARDVGMFIAAVDTLGADSGAARLVVHHTGKNGEDERGSSALRGAADMMHALKPDGAALRLECVKAKDSDPYDPWRLHLSQVAESCVLRCGTPVGRLAPSELSILTAVSESFGTRPASATAIRDAADVPRSSLYRSLRSLTERGFLTENSAGATTHYALTDDGQRTLVPASPSESHNSASTSPTHTASPGGGTWDETETDNPPQTT